MTLKIFHEPEDKRVFLDLMPGKEPGTVTLVTCDARGECISPLLTVREVRYDHNHGIEVTMEDDEVVVRSSDESLLHDPTEKE